MVYVEADMQTVRKAKDDAGKHNPSPVTAKEPKTKKTTDPFPWITHCHGVFVLRLLLCAWFDPLNSASELGRNRRECGESECHVQMPRLLCSVNFWALAQKPQDAASKSSH